MKIRTLTATVLLIGSGLLWATPTNAQLQALVRPTVRLTRTYPLPRAPVQQTVYRLVPQFITTEHARQRARLLGLSPESLARVEQTPSGFEISDNKWDYSLDTARQLETLLDHEVMTGQAGYSPVIPAPEKCRELALQFLGTRNLITGTSHEQLRYERTNEILRAFVRPEDMGRPPGNPRVVLREIVFGKYIGSTPVIGSGTHVSVFIGDRGNVVGFMSDWMPAIPTSERLGVVPPKQAATLLKDQMASTNQSLPDPHLRARDVSAKGCRYILQSFTNDQGEMILLPVYRFRGTLKDAHEQTFSFACQVLAPQNRSQVEARLRLSLLQPEPKPPVTGLQQPIQFRLGPRLKGGIIKQKPPQ